MNVNNERHDKMAAQIDKEIKRIIDEAYNKGEEILKTHIDKLHAVSKRLFEKEKIDADEFREIMENDTEYSAILETNE